MYVLRESILHKLNNVRYWHQADIFTVLQVDYERKAEFRHQDGCGDLQQR